MGQEQVHLGLPTLVDEVDEPGISQVVELIQEDPEGFIRLVELPVGGLLGQVHHGKDGQRLGVLRISSRIRREDKDPVILHDLGHHHVRITDVQKMGPSTVAEPLELRHQPRKLLLPLLGGLPKPLVAEVPGLVRIRVFGAEPLDGPEGLGFFRC